MKVIARSCTLLLIGLSPSFLSVCGFMAVIESHPSLAGAGDGNTAKVYFLRPDIGFYGVVGNAFSISLNGKELLTLEKGEYTLIYLQPVSGVVTVEASTVISHVGMNVMTKVKESRPFWFDRRDPTAFATSLVFCSWGLPCWTLLIYLITSPSL